MEHFLDESLGILTWQSHDGSAVCPIPWAPKGAYRIMFHAGIGGGHVAAKAWNWRKITDWALTDGWIPIVGGRCDQAVGWLAGTWESKFPNGKVLKRYADILSPLCLGDDIVAVRRVEKPETVWVPHNEGEWVSHNGVECPIPWALAGEWSRKLRHGCMEIKVPFAAIDAIGWKHNLGVLDTVAWQLTDGWLPIINGMCPQAVGWKAKEWEWRNAGGDIIKGQHNIEIDKWKFAVAVRRIEQAIKPKKPIKMPLKIEDMFAIPARSAEAYLRFRASPRGKEALAMIGKAEGRQFKPIGEDTINDIAAEALREHDKRWPRKI
jgi:hypothetical protein